MHSRSQNTRPKSELGTYKEQDRNSNHESFISRMVDCSLNVWKRIVTRTRDELEGPEKLTNMLNSGEHTATSSGHLAFIETENNITSGDKRESFSSIAGDSNAETLLQSFLETTSFHGVKYIADNKTKWWRWFWILVVAGCALGSIVLGVTVSLRNYVSPTMYTQMVMMDNLTKTDDKDIPLYPAVTVCNRSPFKNSSFESQDIMWFKTLSLSLGSPFALLNAGDKKIISRLHKFVKVDTESKPFYQKHIEEIEKSKSYSEGNIQEQLVKNSLSCEETFLYCALSGYVFNCCAIFKPIITQSGVCFIHMPEKRLTMLQYQTLNLYFRFSPISVNLAEERGIAVIVHDPREIASVNIVPTTTVVDCWPAMSVALKFKLQQINYNEKYRKKGKTYCQQQKLHVLDMPFTMNNCKYDTNVAAMQELCNCTMVWAHSFERLKMCEHSCMEYKYRTETSYLKLSRSFSMKGLPRENATKISLEYKTLAFTNLYYHSSDKMSVFVSEIGGSMGFMLGASVISLLEGGIFLVNYLWNKLGIRNINFFGSSL
ncbi:bile acid-sensitive ion channel-like [Tachypleus tridentatus]|uniref:bile acid-sensitive ion channel-like n=1 Tax=Tachypleus tridentatus TaxID=6853 RepID=UPI003FD36D69